MFDTSADAQATASAPDTSAADRSWRQIVAPYARSDTRRGLIQLLNTGFPFLTCMGVILYGLDHGSGAALLLTPVAAVLLVRLFAIQRSEEHTSELQSLMRISYAVFC